MKAIITTAICSSLLLMTGCTTSAENKNNTLLITQKTVLASGIEKANIDNTIRPQDNFYRYVNGNWLTSHTIPGDKTAIGSFYDLRDKADNDV
ncbi:MAG TPA: peptidase M13, partial [Colwellia sp.]|nr:peptidase M13 [Colwellia sp.]